jgi:hypothetical protein
MTKVLCWEERPNGRYCKNYRLTGKDKCNNHYIHTNENVWNFLMFIITSYLVFLCVIYYGDNSDMIDNYIYSMKTFILENVKEPVKLGLIEFYKNSPLYKYMSLKY